MGADHDLGSRSELDRDRRSHPSQRMWRIALHRRAEHLGKRRLSACDTATVDRRKDQSAREPKDAGRRSTRSRDGGRRQRRDLACGQCDRRPARTRSTGRSRCERSFCGGCGHSAPRERFVPKRRALPAPGCLRCTSRREGSRAEGAGGRRAFSDSNACQRHRIIGKASEARLTRVGRVIRPARSFQPGDGVDRAFETQEHGPTRVEVPSHRQVASYRRAAAHSMPKPSRFASTQVDWQREGCEPISPSVSRRWPATSRAAKVLGQRRTQGSNPSLSATVS